MNYWMNVAKNLSLLIAAMTAASGCATFRNMFALNNANQEKSVPIHNPFGEAYASGQSQKQNMVLRTKKGDRSVEVEFPGGKEDMSDFVIPVSPAFKDSHGSAHSRYNGSGGATSADPGSAEDYKDRKPTMSDREITSNLPHNLPEDDQKRKEIEEGLGLVQAEDPTPSNGDKSYLASLDNIKQLYKSGRYEIALMEIDGLLREFQTDPKLYEMRGTLLDRLGRTDLALRSWNQALRFDPQNQGLRRFVERRQQKRGLAGK